MGVRFSPEPNIQHCKRQCWRGGSKSKGREQVRGEGSGKGKCPWKDLGYHPLRGEDVQTWLLCFLLTG